MLPETLEHGDEEGCGFARTGSGHGDDVGAGENDRHGLALNWGGDFVSLALDSSVDIGTEIQGLEATGLGFLLLLLYAFLLCLRAPQNSLQTTHFGFAPCVGLGFCGWGKLCLVVYPGGYLGCRLFLV